MRLQHLGIRFVIYRNRRNVGEDEFFTYGVRGVWTIPVIAGSKRAGPVRTIVGITMVTVATIATGSAGRSAADGAWGFVGATGASLAPGGVVRMPDPQVQGLKQSATPENLPNYTFGNARNTTASGNPMPICYGKRRWGEAIISASICVEDKT